MNSLKVALLQILAEETLEGSLQKGLDCCRKANACPMEINRVSQLRARAYENMVGIATVNYPLGQPDCNGHSTAFDGIAYRSSDSGSRDTLIVEAGEREGIYLADFPMDEIRRYRSHKVHGNAYRHPQKYKLVVYFLCPHY